MFCTINRVNLVPYLRFYPWTTDLRYICYCIYYIYFKQKTGRRTYPEPTCAGKYTTDLTKLLHNHFLMLLGLLLCMLWYETEV